MEFKRLRDNPFILFLCSSLILVFLVGSGDCSPTSKHSKKPCGNDQELYYNGTKRCYVPNDFHQGPCGEYMYLAPVGETPFAECKCIHGYEGCKDRPLVHWPEGQRCYYIFEQGPCKELEWLAVKDTVGECQPNRCGPDSESEEGSKHFKFSHKDQCYETNAEAAFCKPDEKVYFVGGSLEPKCEAIDPECSIAMGISFTNPVPCADGKTRDEFGGCSPAADF